MPFRNTEENSFGNTLEEIQKLTIATVASQNIYHKTS